MPQGIDFRTRVRFPPGPLFKDSFILKEPFIYAVLRFFDKGLYPHNKGGGKLVFMQHMQHEMQHGYLLKNKMYVCIIIPLSLPLFTCRFALDTGLK